jgi:macrolide-specific efflux system membrane fusion protein
MKWQWVGAIVLVAVGLGAVAFVVIQPVSGGSGNASYLTAQVTRANVVDSIAANGALAPVDRYGLAFGTAPTLLGSSGSSATSSGTGSSGSGGSGTLTWPVAEVKVSVGQTVKKGDVLATADPVNANNQLTQATNSLNVATLQYDQAQTQLDAATTTSAIQQAQIGYYNAKSALMNAKAAKAAAETAVSLATITAPADGIVEAVNITAGADAPSGDAIVLDSGGFQAQINVTETDLPSLKVGQAASLTITATATTVDGTVSAIAPVATSGGGVVTYPVIVTLASVPADVRAGMSVSVSVTTAQANNVLAVPVIALQGTAGNYNVEVLQSNGQVAVTNVTVGLVTSTLAEITNGLQQGDRVVVGVSTAQNGTTTTSGLGGLGGLGGGGTFRGGFGGRGAGN